MKHLYLCSQIHYVTTSIASSLSDQIRQKCVFIDTPLRAKVHNPKDLGWHEQNIANMKSVGMQLDFYDIAGKSNDDIKRDLAQYQMMYIEGGDPFYLLSVGAKNNFAEYVRDRVENGMLYLGTSAGTIVAGIDAASAARPGKNPEQYGLISTKGYGLVNFVPMPHWGLSEKIELYGNHKLNSSYQEDYPYIFISDDQYIEVIGDNYKIVDVCK